MRAPPHALPLADQGASASALPLVMSRQAYLEAYQVTVKEGAISRTLAPSSQVEARGFCGRAGGAWRFSWAGRLPWQQSFLGSWASRLCLLIVPDVEVAGQPARVAEMPLSGGWHPLGRPWEVFFSSCKSTVASVPSGAGRLLSARDRSIKSRVGRHLGHKRRPYLLRCCC